MWLLGRRPARRLGPGPTVDRATGRIPAGLLADGGVTVGIPGGDKGRPRRCIRVHPPTHHLCRHGSDVLLRICPQERDRGWQNSIPRGTADVLLAPITGQRMQRAQANPPVVVLEHFDELGERILVDQMVESLDAVVPDVGVGVGQATTHRREGGGTTQHQVPVRPLGPMRGGQLRHQLVKFGSGMKSTTGNRCSLDCHDFSRSAQHVGGPSGRANRACSNNGPSPPGPAARPMTVAAPPSERTPTRRQML